ncbi:hypothetical protein MYXA107069_17110 [Myxococcus xanthus]|nr:hypothetical protein [Myxococcus xanthus]
MAQRPNLGSAQGDTTSWQSRAVPLAHAATYHIRVVSSLLTRVASVYVSPLSSPWRETSVFPVSVQEEERGEKHSSH